LWPYQRLHPAGMFFASQITFFIRQRYLLYHQKKYMQYFATRKPVFTTLQEELLVLAVFIRHHHTVLTKFRTL
jgi:hypothetical protein